MLDGFTRALAGAFVGYARDELGFKTDMTYNLLAGEVAGKWQWGDRREPPGVSDDLRTLLSINPSFRLLVAHGRTDLVTPYGVSKYVLDHLPDTVTKDSSESERAQLKVYRGGHMFYFSKDIRRAFTADAKTFYQGARCRELQLIRPVGLEGIFNRFGRIPWHRVPIGRATSSSRWFPVRSRSIRPPLPASASASTSSTGRPAIASAISSSTPRPKSRSSRPIGVKGYEVEKSQYVLVEDEELDEVALESTHTIDVESSCRAARWTRSTSTKSYFIVPSDKVGYEAFAVIRDAMKKEGLVGLARVVLYRRERILMLQPRGKGLMATALRYNTEVRDEKDYFSDIPNIKVPADMLDLAIHILEQQEDALRPGQVRGPLRERLTDLIKAKHAGKPAPKLAAPRPSNVINLMDALKRSVKAEQGGGKSAPRARGSHPRRARAASSHRRSSGHKARVKRAS